MTRAQIVRWVVIAVCIVGIVGMIIGSVGDDNGLALTFGLMTAAAAACLIAATAVSPPGASGAAAPTLDEVQAERVEALVAQLVAAGASEHAVRALVGEAFRLGKSGRR